MNTKSLLTLSIILNLGLLAAGGYLAKQRQTPSSDVVTREVAKTNGETRVHISPKRVVTVTNEVAQKFDWHAVESADYKEYIKNLRSIGCPEETIRDIIIADVNKLFAARKKELGGKKKFEFWKAGNMFSGLMDEEKIKQQQQLAEEKKALLTELLGFAPEEKIENVSATMINSMLDFLPDEKQSVVNELMTKFQSKVMKSMKGGTPDAEDMKEMMKVQKEYEAELAKVLTPEEFEDYQLRLSQTSMIMRMQLGAFEPNEQEFRDLFKLKKAFDDEYGWAGSGATTKEEREKMKTAQKDLDARIKDLLGESRFVDYERSQDHTYQALVKIADRNQLPRDAVNRVHDMNTVSKDQIKKLRDDKSMESAQRDAAIKAIRDETQASIKEVLGEKAYESYTNRPGFYP